MHLPGPPVQLGLQAPGPVLARRALLPLPLLLLTGLPLRTPAVDTFEFNGKAGLTELEVRAQMTKKLEAAALSGKGIDIDKRGQFNEKALFSEDFYFKFGLRPTPEDLKNKPVEDLPFAPIQRRYTGYKKYEERIKAGLDLYGGVLRTKVQEGAWADVGPLLEKGVKGKGLCREEGPLGSARTVPRRLHQRQIKPRAASSLGQPRPASANWAQAAGHTGRVSHTRKDYPRPHHSPLTTHPHLSPLTTHHSTLTPTPTVTPTLTLTLTLTR